MKPRPVSKQSFAARLREKRRGKGKTQQEMAAALEVPPGTYVNWEQDRKRPRKYVQRAILER